MEEKENLKTKITEWRDERYTAQKIWSGIHHTCLFGSILCSIAAGTVIQFSGDFSTLGTLLASLAAVLTGIAASGGFERKWRSNRLSRSKGDLLLLDLDIKTPDLQRIRKNFKAALEKHDLEIIAEEPENH